VGVSRSGGAAGAGSDRADAGVTPDRKPGSGSADASAAGSTRSSSQSGKVVSPGRKVVTTAKPAGSVAVSSTLAFSLSGRRPSRPASCDTKSGPASSARCTMTTRPVDTSCAVCDRTPPPSAVHLRSR
jgi:hypothetical protein